MQLCFVSVHGPRETYFVDAPRTSIRQREAELFSKKIHLEFVRKETTNPKFRVLLTGPDLKGA
jgi:hypothetical protein